MNGAQATTPDTVAATPADAICAIGFGSDLTSGSGNETNTFGNGVLINGGTQILCAVHVLPFNSSGYHTLPRDTSTTARICRFRRLLNGTAPVDGTAANSFQVYIAGYRVHSPNLDVAICDLATTVTHIPSVAIDSGHPAVSDACVLAGWGSTSATDGTVVRPNDVRLISSKTLSNVQTDGTSGLATFVSWSGVNPGPNIYDSGGPVMRVDGGGNWMVCGIIINEFDGVAIEQFKHDATFQIAGLYSPGTDQGATDPSTWVRSDDTYLVNLSPTQNNSAATTFSVQPDSGVPFHAKDNAVLVGFNVASLGKTPKSSRLVLTVLGVSGGAMTLNVYRILRHGVTALANWNTYDGTNNWTTAGGTGAGTDINTGTVATLAIAGTETQGQQVVLSGAALDAMVTAALADDGILRLLLNPGASGGTPTAQFYSHDAAVPGNWPYLEVTYADNSGKLSRAGRVEARAARIARV